jgi:hypothetical protein
VGRHRDPEKAKKWAGILADWKASGLSQRAYAQEHGLAASTLAWWAVRLDGVTTPSHSNRKKPGTDCARSMGLAEVITVLKARRDALDADIAKLEAAERIMAYRRDPDQ